MTLHRARVPPPPGGPYSFYFRTGMVLPQQPANDNRVPAVAFVLRIVAITVVLTAVAYGLARLIV